jgi:hypothetical protein
MAGRGIRPGYKDKKTAADKEENGGGGKRYWNGSCPETSVSEQLYLRSSYPRHPKNVGGHYNKNKKDVTELQESKKKQSCHGPYQTTLLL